MKIKTSYCYHSPTGHEWGAYFDDLFPDGAVGSGGTERAAIDDMLWQVDQYPVMLAAVEARLEQLGGVPA